VRYTSRTEGGRVNSQDVVRSTHDRVELVGNSLPARAMVETVVVTVTVTAGAIGDLGLRRIDLQGSTIDAQQVGQRDAHNLRRGQSGNLDGVVVIHHGLQRGLGERHIVVLRRNRKDTPGVLVDVLVERDDGSLGDPGRLVLCAKGKDGVARSVDLAGWHRLEMDQVEVELEGEGGAGEREGLAIVRGEMLTEVGARSS
jgi:hypothetical protein